MTFPGSIKGCANPLSVSSSLILAAEHTNIQHEESAFNHGPLFLLETIPLSSIHSSKANWFSKLQVECLIPALTFAIVFFHLYDSQYKIIFLAVIRVFGTHQYSRPLICFPPFLNIKRQKPNICLCYICIDNLL